jgi:hypothetical protein
MLSLADEQAPSGWRRDLDRRAVAAEPSVRDRIEHAHEYVVGQDDRRAARPVSWDVDRIQVEAAGGVVEIGSPAVVARQEHPAVHRERTTTRHSTGR